MSTSPCILFIAPQPFYEDRGTPIAVHQELKAYSDLKYTVHLVTYPLGKEVVFPGLRIFRVVNLFRCRSVRIGFSVHKLFFDFLLLLKTLKLIRRSRYDYVHCVEESVFIGLFWKWLFGIPVIYDMHSILTEQLEKSGLFKIDLIKRFAKRIETVAIRRADCLIGSHGLQSHVDSVAPDKVILECWFEAECPSRKNAMIAQKLGLNGYRLLVYTGNFSNYQGIDLLIEAATLVRQTIPDVKFLLVGGTEDETVSLTALLRRNRLSDTVLLHRRLPRQEIPEYLTLGDALVMPRPKGFNAPLKIYSYILAEKPIVATNVPAHTSILDEKTAILVDPDPRSLSDGIISALTDHERVKRIVEASRIAFEKNRHRSLKSTILNASSIALKRRFIIETFTEEARTCSPIL